MKIRSLALCLSAAVLAVPSLAAAEETPDITAFGHAQGGWLRTAGPDGAGLYRVSIGIADLDPATDAGWRTMNARAQRGSAVLCEIASEGPQVAGYHNKGQRRCLSEAGDLAARQMDAAREASRQGRSVATLGMAAMAR